MSPSSHLHPRSTATSTLFAGTLLASFIVVGIPHVFPCPRPRRGFADSEATIDKNGSVVRKSTQTSSALTDTTQGLRSKIPNDKSVSGSTSKSQPKQKSFEEEAILFKQLQEEATQLDQARRECPVPKPGGVVGKWLGFGGSSKHALNGVTHDTDPATTILSTNDTEKR